MKNKAKNKEVVLHPFLENILADARPSMDQFVAVFAGQLPLLNELKNTQQDPEWHAEGNVFVHTEMVLQHVYKLLESKASYLTKDEHFILILSAVFHDIAKPICTKTRRIYGKDRIVSPRHADRGRSYMAYKLLDFGLDAKTVRRVMEVVGHHHDPKQLVVKDKPVSQYKRLARLAPLHLLYWLEQADMRGRICRDLEEQLDILEMFKLTAMDANLWENTHPYTEWEDQIQKEPQDLDFNTQALILANAIKDFEAGEIYTVEEAIARSYNYRDGYSHLIVCCGPSGSGKSTWIEQNYPDYAVVSLDELRVELTGKREDQSKNGQVSQLAKERLKICLQNNQNVIWDATNLTTQRRQQIIQLGLNYNAKVSLVVFHKSMPTIHKNNRERPHPVPEPILEKQFKNVEFPYLDEAHEIIYID